MLKCLYKPMKCIKLTKPVLPIIVINIIGITFIFVHSDYMNLILLLSLLLSAVYVIIFILVIIHYDEIEIGDDSSSYRVSSTASESFIYMED